MEILYDIMSIVAVLAGVVMPVLLVVFWILRPVDQAGKYRQAPIRFSIADFLCLFLSVQVPLAAVYQFIYEEEEGLFWTFTVVTWVVAPLIWFTCARALSKAGVDYWGHRFMFMGLIAPFVYYGLLPYMILSIAGVLTLVYEERLAARSADPWLLFAWLVLALLFFLSGLFVRWMLRRAQPKEVTSAHSDEIAE